MKTFEEKDLLETLLISTVVFGIAVLLFGITVFSENTEISAFLGI